MGSIKLWESYPDIYRTIMQWYDEDIEVSELAELKHNGAGKQVVLRYPSHVFMDVLKFTIKMNSMRSTLTAREKADVARVLMGTCLFNNNMIADVLRVSKATVVAWGATRPERFPMKRLGGEINMDAIPILLGWLQQRVEKPGENPRGWLLNRAIEEGATWPAVARLVGLTVQAAKKAANSMDKENPVDINIHVNLEASDRAFPAGSTKLRPEGHPSGGIDSGPGDDDLDGEGESLLAPPVSVSADNDAFAPAVYLASDHEADGSDAGLADAPEDGLHEGSEGDLGEGGDRADRGTHPFFLA